MSGLKTPEPLLRELQQARRDLRLAMAGYGYVRGAQRKLADVEARINFVWRNQVVPEPLAEPLSSLGKVLRFHGRADQ